MDTQLYIKAYSLIKSSQNILIVTHEHPDGDAVASAAAMGEVAALAGKKYTLFCRDALTYKNDFLPRLDEFKTELDNFAYDLIIVVDCGSVERTGLTEKILGRRPEQKVLEIDHHPKIRDYADLEIRDPRAAATAEIIYYFLKVNRIRINKNLANCVLAGILTDTGNFLYPSTSPQTINIASEMLRRGARLPQIMESTWRNKSIAAMKTWGKAMSNLSINRQYNFAFTVLRAEDVPADLSEDELEGMSGFLSNLEEVNALMVLRELPDGKIKGSLRTAKPDVDVSKLARSLGGGGHAKAAGFIIEGSLQKTESGWKII